MNATARPWIGLACKCCAALALIFAFVFFMRMQEEQSNVDRYRAEGMVSRAEVVGKQVDQVRYEGRRGNSRTEDWEMVTVRYAKDSTVPFADFPALVGEADLPAPPPATGDPLVDSQFEAVIFVSAQVYAATQVGQQLVVVDTPYSGDDPEFIAAVRDFDPASFYPAIALSLALMVIFGLIGWRVGRRRGEGAG